MLQLRRDVVHKNPHVCSCGAELDSSQAPNCPVGTQPSPGDLTICLYCCAVYIYKDDGDLRRLTTEEYEQLKKDPEQWDELQRVMEDIKIYRGERN